MSTQYLAQVVKAAKAGHAVDGIVADRALLELDRINQAAIAWASRGTVVPGDQMRDFWVLLEDIASSIQEPAPAKAP